MIKIFLERSNIHLSKTTVHKYMNKELKLHSIVFRKKPGYVKGKAHKVFPNLLKQNFHSEKTGEIFCTDFTYVRLQNGSMKYNCTILDLYDRSIVSTVTGDNITSELAIRTLKLALKKKRSKKLILHSDQGSQFTSKEFINYCKRNDVIQSMSKAGCHMITQ